MEASRGAERLSTYIDSRPWSTAQKLVLVLGALAFAADGLANQILGIAMPAIIAEWGVPREALAPVAAIGLFGVAIGSILGGTLGDRIGRRRGLILSVLLFAAMTLLAAAVTSPETLALVRFVDGIGIGAAIPNGAALLTETAPRNRRAITIAMGMVFIPVGGTLSGLLGALVLEDLGWRALFVVVGLLCLGIALVFFLFLPESPAWLVHHEARRAELAKVVRRLTGPIPPGTRFYEPTPTREEKRWLGLLAADVRWTSIGIWAGFFFCLLATYTIFSWLPTLLHEKHFALHQSSVAMTAFHSGAMCGGVMGGIIMHRYGSRLPTIVMAGISALVAASLALLPMNPDAALPVFAVFAILGLLLAGMHNGFYTLAADAYPPVLRASGMGATSAFGRLGAIASSFTGALSMSMATGGGVGLYFLGIAGALLLSMGAAFLTRPKS